MADENVFAYVGIKKCGCMTCACVDTPEYKIYTSEFVKNCVKDGLVVERHGVDYVRKNLKRCKCDKK